MTNSYTHTQTFTQTHAVHIAAKVATDLKRMQRFYQKPIDSNIVAYEQEIVALLRAGYLGTVTYGFKRNGLWVRPMLRYSARYLSGQGVADDDPGSVQPGADTTGATFSSYLTHSASWNELSDEQREAFEEKLPFRRGVGVQPEVAGVLVLERTYSAGGHSLLRETIAR